jgi:hypothetical protein
MHPSVVRTDGHVIVGYEIRQTGSKAELVCYDSNYPPNSSGARPTVVHFDLEAGSYEVRNHYGTKSYTDYDVITTIDPENYFIRGMTREMTRELEKYLWLTDKFYTVMETVQKEEVEERWVDWKKDFLNAWKADKDRYKENTSRLLRYSIRMPR